MQLCGSLNILWHFPSLGLEWKLTFSSPVATAEFSKFAGILKESPFTASSFRIWNSSAEIPSPPPPLFIVMLLKAHLISHARMSHSRSVITLLWLSVSWRSFLYSSSMCSYYVFLMSSASVRSIPFLSFIVPILAWDIYLVSPIFWKRSLVFPILLFSSISLHWPLRKVFISLLAILWNSAFKWVYLSFSLLPLSSLLSLAIFKASSDNHFSFLLFFFLGMVLITAFYIQCHKLPPIALQAWSSDFACTFHPLEGDFGFLFETLYPLFARWLKVLTILYSEALRWGWWWWLECHPHIEVQFPFLSQGHHDPQLKFFQKCWGSF